MTPRCSPTLLVGRCEHFTDKDLPKPPVLAVEILSPSTRMIDTEVKRARFERAGTQAYWVLDPCANPAEARLTVWILDGRGPYRCAADVMGKEPFTTEFPSPVTVVPADLVR